MRGLLFVLSLIIATTLYSQQPRLVLPIGHTDFVFSATFSPDGKHIISCSSDNTVKIWNVNTGKLLAELTDSTGIFISAAYSPDGKSIMTVSGGNNIKIWNASTCELTNTFKIQRVDHNIEKAYFSPDGKRILTCSGPNLIVLDVLNGDIQLDFRVDNDNQQFSYQYSPDGESICTVSWDNSIDNKFKIWDAATGGLKFEIQHESEEHSGKFAEFSSDGKFIMTTVSLIDKGVIGSCKIWDAHKGEKIFEPDAGSFIKSAFIHPDGKSVLTTSNGVCRIWDIVTGKLQNEIRIENNEIDFARYNYDGTKILVDPVSGRYHILANAKDGQQIGSMRFEHNPNKAVYSPDGRKLLTASSNAVILLDATSGKRIHELTGNVRDVIPIMYSPDGKDIITAGSGNLWIWNASNGVINKTINGDFTCKQFNSKWNTFLSVDEFAVILLDAQKEKTIKDITTEYRTPSAWFSMDQNYFFVRDNYKGQDNMKIFNARNGALQMVFEKTSSLDINPDGKIAISISGDTSIYFWDIATKKIITKKGTRRSYSIRFSPDGKYIISKGTGEINVLNASDGSLKYTIEGDIRTMGFSPDGRMLITVSIDEKAIVRDLASGAIARQFDEPVNFCQYSPKGKYIITSHRENGDKTKVWEAASGKLVSEMNIYLHAMDDYTSSVVFSADEKQFITAYGGKNSLYRWDMLQAKLLSTFFIVNDNDFFNITTDGFYHCTTEAARLLYYVSKTLQVITFEQLDVKYNRPDKVLEAIGNTDTALIKSYRKAWEKRIKKLGIDTTAFRDGYSVPECDFVNRDAVEYEQKTGTLALHIKGIDSTYQLDRFNIWVNEVPVFGQRGISIRKKNSNQLDTTIKIKLSQGENRIESSITNVNGTESYRMPLIVNYTPEIRQKETLRFIGIGIDKFSDPKHNLQYSSKDIRDLSVKLKEKYKDDIIIDTLFNEHVTISNVKALKQKLQETSVNDKVIISYSGHGLLSKEYDYYLSTYSINFDHPEENGLPYEELENLLDSIPARKKLMLIDACHSGEVDKEEITHYKAAEDSLAKQGTKGGELRYTGRAQVGMKNSFELMQSLFVNVGKNTGATIISAAAGTQFALERGDLKNGVFTYSILEAMDKNPGMKISELKKTVGERVEQLTNGLQKPTSRSESIAVDWSLW